MATLTERYPGQRVARWYSRISLKSLAFWPALVFVALFCGLTCVFLPWWFVVGVILMVAYPLGLWLAPWVGLGFYIVLLVVSPDFKYSDVITAASLVIIGAKIASSGPWPRLPKLEFWSFTITIVLVIASLALALGVFHNTVPFIYRDGRAFVYWLWLPLLYALIHRDPAGRAKLSKLILFVAVAIGTIALVQYFFQIQIVREGRVGGLETLGVGDNDLTRVQMQGFVFVVVGLVWAIVSATQGGRRLFYLVPLLLFFVAALYVNFGRALWAWTAVAVLMSGLVMGLRRAVVLALSLTVVGVLSVTTLLLVKPTVIESVVDRLGSVVDEGGVRTSGGWRKLENEAADAQIIRSPLVGIGLGGEYRGWISEIRNFKEHTRYVHNGYVFIAVKLGVPALLAMLCLNLWPWWRAFRSRSTVGFEPRSMWIAIVASWLPVLGLSLTQPEIVTPQTIMLMCMGLAAMIAKPGGAPSMVPPLRGAQPAWRMR
jgi:O-antigen ligase